METIITLKKLGEWLKQHKNDTAQLFTHTKSIYEKKLEGKYGGNKSKI